MTPATPIAAPKRAVYTAAPAQKAVQITRHHQLGADFALVQRRGIKELHITLQPAPGEPPAMMLVRLDTLLREYGATVTRMEILGSRKEYAASMASLRGLMGEPAFPILWADGAGFDGQPVAGIHAMAVIGPEVQTLLLNDRVIGTMFGDRHARHALLGAVLPTNPRATRARQAREVFENMALALETAEMEPRDIARTWLYLDDLLSWYDDLNRERTQLFRQWDLLASGLPASTAVGASNPHGAAIVAGAWATVPLDASAKVREVLSPLQCPAVKYGSSFARAMEWGAPDHRRLMVSGTASLEPGGASAHRGDIHPQVDLAMDVVEAMLESRGVSFADVTRATAYIKHPQHAAALEDWFERTGKPWFPAVATHTQVCRDELLFEIELDTITVA